MSDGSAILDPAVLVDDLVPTVDELREDLERPFGVRPFRTFKVVRTWEGDTVGEGGFTDVEREILPSPLVTGWDGRRWVQNFCGLEEDGQVRLTMVSLSYTYPELTDGAADNATVLYRLDEAYGQLQPPRWFRLEAPPFPDREDDIGWVIRLRTQRGVS